MKYRSHETDLSALQRELHGESSVSTDDESVEDEYDEWSDYSDSRSRD